MVIWRSSLMWTPHQSDDSCLYPSVECSLTFFVFSRDNNKPINILTGIDYWLDNLMCNVPELVMCFHVNGIVQVNDLRPVVHTWHVCLMVAAVNTSQLRTHLFISEIWDDKNGGHSSSGEFYILHKGGEGHRSKYSLLPQVQLHQRGSHLLALQRYKMSEQETLSAFTFHFMSSIFLSILLCVFSGPDSQWQWHREALRSHDSVWGGWRREVSESLHSPCGRVTVQVGIWHMIHFRAEKSLKRSHRK